MKPGDSLLLRAHWGAVRRVPLMLLLLLCPCEVGTGKRGCSGVESQLLDSCTREGPCPWQEVESGGL